MFAIVEKMISLTSVDVRLALAGKSVVFSYLIFINFKFCLCKFKDLITLNLYAKFIFLYQSHQKHFLPFLEKSILNFKLYSQWQI